MIQLGLGLSLSLVRAGAVGGELPPIESNNPVQFTNPNSATGTWFFGDGAFSADVDPLHEYLQHGEYDVIFTSDSGNDDLAFPITVLPMSPPVASFTSSYLELVSTVDASTSTADSPLTYDWTYNEGQTETGVTADLTYTVSGDKPVELVVIDSDNSWDTVTNDVFVNDTPIAGFTHESTLLSVNFFDASSDSVGITARQWDFGQGDTSASKDPAGIIYPALGTYLVTLSARDAIGLWSDEYSEMLTVSDEYLLGPELNPSDIVGMTGDSTGIAIPTSITFGFNPVAPETMDLNGSTASARMNFACAGLGLELGKRYLTKFRIKATPGTVCYMAFFTVGSMPNTPVPDDGLWHDLEIAFTCTDVNGATRVYCNGTAMIDSYELAEVTN